MAYSQCYITALIAPARHLFYKRTWLPCARLDGGSSRRPLSWSDDTFGYLARQFSDNGASYQEINPSIKQEQCRVRTLLGVDSLTWMKHRMFLYWNKAHFHRFCRYRHCERSLSLSRLWYHLLCKHPETISLLKIVTGLLWDTSHFIKTQGGVSVYVRELHPWCSPQ